MNEQELHQRARAAYERDKQIFEELQAKVGETLAVLISEFATVCAICVITRVIPEKTMEGIFQSIMKLANFHEDELTSWITRFTTNRTLQTSGFPAHES